MKKTVLVAIIIFCISGCSKYNETKELSSYLHSFGIELKHFKVVAFVPADGCSSCIIPTLDNLKNGKDCF